MSVVATSPAEAEAEGDFRGAIEARVDQLQVRHRLRSGALDDGHVAALAELEGRWPPLLVWADHPDVVLDGAHRLAAARLLGYRTVKVTAFCGTADEAFVEAVQRNVEHGLPLTVPDRLRAGQQILARHPDWSDRRIGGVCALSPHTVARLRSSAPPARPGPGQVVEISTRLGRDGRHRPAQPGVVRDRVMDALRANPAGSLRDIAGVARVSPETVRRIRKDFDTSLPALIHDICDEEPAGDWRGDVALTANPELSDLVEWLERTDPGDTLAPYTDSVPLSRVYQLADEARRRAGRWAAFAAALEARARSRSYSAV